MAQYDIHLVQNTAPSGVEFTEKAILLTRGGLITTNASNNPVVLAAGTQAQHLVVDANGDLKWETPSAGHTQGTDTGTTAAAFDLDSDGTTNGVKLKTTTGALSLRNLADDAYADLTVEDLVVNGGITFVGNATEISKTVIVVEDKNIEIGKVGTPTDTTADGGGITLKGATDKTLIWDSANGNWTSNQDFNLASGKVFKINNVQLNQDNFGDGTTNKAYTATEKSKLSGIEASAVALATVKADTDIASAISLKHASASIGATPNGLSISGQEISLALASTSATGALSSTDWNTFNGKRNGTVTAPAAYNSTGTTGQEAFDGNYFYYCYNTNLWARSAMAKTWAA